MSSGFFTLVEIGPIAMAFGEYVMPMRKSTLSLMISSCARRFAVSGARPPSSRLMISSLRPAIESPCSFMNAATAASATFAPVV